MSFVNITEQLRMYNEIDVAIDECISELIDRASNPIEKEPNSIDELNRVLFVTFSEYDLKRKYRDLILDAFVKIDGRDKK